VKNAFGRSSRSAGPEAECRYRCTPHHTHYQLVKDALNAARRHGRKTMVLDPGSGTGAGGAATEQNLHLHVGYHFPSPATAQLLRNLIHRRIGDIFVDIGGVGTHRSTTFPGNTDIFGEIFTRARFGRPHRDL